MYLKIPAVPALFSAPVIVKKVSHGSYRSPPITRIIRMKGFVSNHTSPLFSTDFFTETQRRPLRTVANCGLKPWYPYSTTRCMYGYREYNYVFIHISYILHFTKLNLKSDDE